MSRRPDPARIEAARRAAAVARLISAGEPPDWAAAWVDRWAAEVTAPHARSDWEAFDAWLARERHRKNQPDPEAPPGTA